ncbi:methylated-DNA--[protein]-cysteine S-methyltransferase [Peptoniphilus sp. BV3C26]|uniref:methylated-DNA--[protein]-cysteine S-methyltransferase n=1 Tax=Peptoniphilus sp. BV3C26 TaxID=1111134 RepID=UPI0003B8779D|nr:methylated-DNA--[protein]-cysteine S-methyltransferase [Peptoniphilus sp. BV3C26]ERT59497.1 DNA-binding domain, methylated-DNA-[protein]-cysteine S-methyltransferase family protein [Peptoniphilus sp. BV3C26]
MKFAYYKTDFDPDKTFIEIGYEKDFIKSIKLLDGISHKDEKSKISDKCFKELEEYFKGKRKKFTVKFKAHGTEFQEKCWKELLKIPYGQTKTYGQIAEEIKNPKAARAVGNANNKNPLWIIIPCHRVLGKNGSLTGYAGGLKIKEKLLKLEKENL